MMCVMTGQLVLFGPVPFLKLLRSHKCVFFIYLACITIVTKSLSITFWEGVKKIGHFGLFQISTII